jgi:hypothetical protein
MRAHGTVYVCNGPVQFTLITVFVKPQEQLQPV